ncbi:MAG TPA: DUF4870 domain-containing protein [Gemmataceae bacterium]|nr:DUF4870 domain-containing protein [Gemmataceae bacterium]
MSHDITSNAPPPEPPPPIVPVADGDAPSRGLTQDEKTWGMLCHLSALVGLAVGGFTFLGPLICWLVKKDESAFIDRHGKESLNFQLNMLVLALLTIPLVFITFGILFFLPLAVAVVAIVMPIIAGMKANNGEEYQYPYIVRVIK